MIYLKDLNNNIKELKESDVKTVDALISTGRWVKCSGRKDFSVLNESKKATKKSTKKTSKKSK
tara:strand:- start:400 stop:588 length:189 start_codon:yes stop_codon:yes gene_type:complete